MQGVVKYIISFHLYVAWSNKESSFQPKLSWKIELSSYTLDKWLSYILLKICKSQVIRQMSKLGTLGFAAWANKKTKTKQKCHNKARSNPEYCNNNTRISSEFPFFLPSISMSVSDCPSVCIYVCSLCTTMSKTLSKRCITELELSLDHGSLRTIHRDAVCFYPAH